MRVNKQKLPKVEQVKLKPFMGLEPGKYLVLLYSLAILIVVFAICILPDLLHPSKRVTFSSAAGEVAVYVDNLYLGGTPFTTKVPSGKHLVEFKLNEVSLDSFEIHVSKPVFLAWLFPRKMDVFSSKLLNRSSFDSLGKEFVSDVVTYSFINDYDSVTVYPPLFENFAKAAKISSFDAQPYISTALLFVTSQPMVEDAQKACSILGLSNKVVIQSSTPDKVTKAFLDNSGEVGCYVNKSYFIGRKLVSESEYAKFLEANPSWAKNNKASLIEKGLVDSFYLEDFIGSPLRPVKNISWYAANAYCQWLSSCGNRVYRLPTEAEWTSVCLSADKSFQSTLVNASESKAPVGMLGGLWEMTSTYYVPGDRNCSEELKKALDSYGADTDIIVKGGSYISSAPETNAYTFGNSPKSLCSDFMGFRVIWY